MSVFGQCPWRPVRRRTPSAQEAASSLPTLPVFSEKMCTINANPEVSGIGIRLSLYTSSMIIACVPRVEETEELRKSLTHAAGLNGVALLVCAIFRPSGAGLIARTR